jgi:hypothetical protein
MGYIPYIRLMLGDMTIQNWHTFDDGVFAKDV